MIQLSDFTITQKWPAQQPQQLRHLVGIGNFPEVKRVLARFVARPAVAASLEIPKAAA